MDSEKITLPAKRSSKEIPIDLMSDGEKAEFLASLNDFAEEVFVQQPDTLMFFDKSARPLSWAIIQILKSKYGKEFPIPKIKYVSVGREKTSSPHGSFSDEFLVESLKQHLSRQRGAFSGQRVPTIEPESLVWLVDDSSVSGKTMKKATRLFHTVFQDTTFVTKSILDHLPPWWGYAKWSGVDDPINSSLDFRSMGYPQKTRSRQLRKAITKMVNDNSSYWQNHSRVA